MSNRLLAGRYELLEKIGDGGMAVVYKAKDKLLNRFIAIKILRPEFTKDPTFVENFKRESQAAAGLAHQNIVAVYDVGREGNINYIVMELVEGQTLNEIIAKEAPMDYRRVIEITKQVAAALRVAHRNKIIHRDVKPHNIMVTTDGIVKLADFGIAKAVNDATMSTGSKIIGSVHYFSPEQARGNYVDERSDIYSLGIVMYEMLTGQVPFDGDNPVTIALKHINEEITPPSQLVDGIPPALEQCVLKATSKFQTNRYSSADELIEELNNIEFVTRMVGNSIFNEASEQVEQSRKGQTDEDEDDYEEEDDSESRRSRRKKKPKKKLTKAQKKRRILIAAVAALVIGLGVAVAAFNGAFSSQKSVPDLYGMTLKEAKKEAEASGFKIKEGKEVYSNDYSKGQVAEQDPESDSKAVKGTSITIHLSKGPQAGTVPNLVGRDESEAESLLKSSDYELGTVKQQTSTEAAGTILSQDPSGGEEADHGTTVNIVVSDGKGVQKSTVPSITGKTLADAKRELRSAGFKVGKVTYEESNAYGSGYVMWQQYAANTELNKGTSVDIEVSKGAPKTSSNKKPSNQKPDNGDGDGSQTVDEQ
ncbi:MAG: Stk1 family PASTA domain-containing Ser/Thr kinase [Eubacteriales bacterium]|nr:Stk1 family PASTA domain-containing Ser/Thr kinase [Eubacteriales bacterium]